MERLFTDFFELLPRLIAGTLIFMIGFSIVLLPVIGWHFIRRSQAVPTLLDAALSALAAAWLFVAGLVVVSLAVNALDVDPLSTTFERLVVVSPFLALILAVVVFAVTVSRRSSEASVSDSERLVTPTIE